MGVLDAQLHVGSEANYASAAVPTRSFEALADGHKRPPTFIESMGMRAGMQGMRSDRRRVVDMGAEGTIELDILTKGFGLLWEVCFGASTIAQQSATPAWLQTHNFTADGAVGKSRVVQLGRPPITGATLPFTYRGGKVKSWEISQKVADGKDGNAKLKLEMDYEREDTVTALASAAYPSSAALFAWPDLALTVNGAAVDIKEFSTKAELSIDTDRRFLRGSVYKREPLRKGVPEVEGKLDCEFTDMTQYNRVIAGDVFPIVATWTGALISGAFNNMMRLTLAACQYSGETPEVSGDNLPSQPLPFKVLWDGTNPMTKLEYQAVDVSY